MLRHMKLSELLSVSVAHPPQSCGAGAFDGLLLDMLVKCGRSVLSVSAFHEAAEDTLNVVQETYQKQDDWACEQFNEFTRQI